MIILVVLMPYAAWIPMPAIAAILFMVAYNMSGWREFVRLCKCSPKSDVLVLVATFVLTVVFDLVVAIEVGIILAAVISMYALCIFVLGMDAILREYREMGMALTLACLLMGNVSLLLYDRLLMIFTRIYVDRVRPKLVK